MSSRRKNVVSIVIMILMRVDLDHSALLGAMMSAGSTDGAQGQPELKMLFASFCRLSVEINRTREMGAEEECVIKKKNLSLSDS